MPVPDTLATWVGSIGTVGALCAGVIELRRENRRKWEAAAAARQATAGSVFGYTEWFFLPDEKDPNKVISDRRIVMVNDTSLPVFNVDILADGVFLSGILVLGPGEKSDDLTIATIAYAEERSQTLTPERKALFDSLGKPRSTHEITVEFTDTLTTQWRTSTKAAPVQITVRTPKPNQKPAAAS